MQYSKTTVVSVDKPLQTLSLQVVPNPVQSTFTLRHSSANSGARLIIRGIDGRMVAMRRAEAGSTATHFSGPDLPNGSYIASFENDGRVVTALLVK